MLEEGIKGLDTITLAENERDTYHFWKRWLKDAQFSNGAKRHREDAKAAWKEYENKPSEDGSSNGDSSTRAYKPYPIYWASCKTIEPAFYARTPKVSTKRRLGVNDEVARVGSIAAERLGEYLTEYSDFDNAMMAAVQDFIHADKATTQLVYEEEYGEQEVQVPLIAQGDSFLTQEGMMWEEEVLQGEMGEYFGVKKESVRIKQCAKVVPLSYDDTLHTPEAKHEGEITEKAYYFILEKAEAKKRFGDEVCSKINWKTKKSLQKETDDDYDKPEDGGTETLGQFVEGWEIWDKVDKKVRWVSKQHPDGILDTKDDPYGLHGFFPSTKFIIGSKPSKSMYPTPAYVQVKHSISELHNASEKVSRLIDGIRRRALVDGANEDLIYALNDLEGGEFVAMHNLQQMLEKGTVENLVYWVPVQELVNAITELNTLQEKLKNDFYELFGVPDILRGASDPLETLGAQQIKQQSAHDRFKFQKKLVAQLARDSIEMMVDLALQTFDDAYLAEICGVQYMEPADQQLFPQAIEMLRNDKTRKIRIDIDTDSLTFVDEQLRSQLMSQTTQTVTQGLQQVAQMAQTSPQFGYVGMITVLKMLETMAPGKEFEGEVKGAISGLLQQIMNPPETPPPPDYEMMKIQLKQMEVQADAQAKQRELDQKEMKVVMQTQVAQAQAQLAEYEAVVKAQKTQNDMQVDNMQLVLDETLQRFMMQMEAHQAKMEESKLSLEAIKTKLAAAEMQMEEMRLARQQDIEMLNTIASSQIETNEKMIEKASSLPPPPAVNVVVQMPKTRRRTGRVVYDELGNATLQVDEELDDFAPQSVMGS